MLTTITPSQIWHNTSLMGFFFRQQAQDTFEHFMHNFSTYDYAEVFNTIDDYFTELDECEEVFYSNSVEEIIELLNLKDLLL